MDSSLVSFEVKENYLLVIGLGKRDNLATMTQASSQIFDKAREVNASRLLVDYRKLQINVHLSEAFNIVKRYEKAQPDMKAIRIAAVFSENGLEFGRYWKQIARQKGFDIEIFQSMSEAEEWLTR